MASHLPGIESGRAAYIRERSPLHSGDVTLARQLLINSLLRQQAELEYTRQHIDIADYDPAAFASKRQRRLQPMALSKAEKRYVAKMRKKAPQTLPTHTYKISYISESYPHMLTWLKANFIVMALGDTLYGFNAKTGASSKIHQVNQEMAQLDSITALTAASDRSSTLAMAELGYGKELRTTSYTRMVDITTLQLTGTLDKSYSQTIAMASQDALLATGGEDERIALYDIRQEQSLVQTLEGGTHNVCSLLWGQDAQLVSGDFQGIVTVWDLRQSAAIHTLEAPSAIQSLAWHPRKRATLFTGETKGVTTFSLRGAAPEMRMRQNTEEPANHISIGNRGQALVSPHRAWQIDRGLGLRPHRQLDEHTPTPSHAAMSPDGTTLCTANSLTQEMRIWHPFRQ